MFINNEYIVSNFTKYITLLKYIGYEVKKGNLKRYLNRQEGGKRAKYYYKLSDVESCVDLNKFRIRDREQANIVKPYVEFKPEPLDAKRHKAPFGKVENLLKDPSIIIRKVA